ncbi:hypothetical protein TIFTF001_012869 [Ficus carica]|uniref:Uncharacterized protein n=1 Tax=Ficus carica TaxID=3494 RepID=A0AA88D2B3_FICCA|nr:hypothetical protein TIFTF001_012869 [Ficus carica]
MKQAATELARKRRVKRRQEKTRRQFSSRETKVWRSERASSAEEIRLRSPNAAPKRSPPTPCYRTHPPFLLHRRSPRPAGVVIWVLTFEK